MGLGGMPIVHDGGGLAAAEYNDPITLRFLD